MLHKLLQAPPGLSPERGQGTVIDDCVAGHDDIQSVSVEYETRGQPLRYFTAPGMFSSAVGELIEKQPLPNREASRIEFHRGPLSEAYRSFHPSLSEAERDGSRDRNILNQISLLKPDG